MKIRATELSGVFVLVLMIAAAGGWIANIYKLATMAFEPVTTILIIRAIGIAVAPVGAVMGYI
jgi:hypothetical protein